MGSWGIKAIESDSGLDLVDAIETKYSKTKYIDLSQVILFLKEDGFLSKTDEIEYLYDSSTIAIAELYKMFQENGKFLVFSDEANKGNLTKRFIASNEIVAWLLQSLQEIKDEKPDKNGQREYVELWKASKSWKKWSNHMDELIRFYKNEIIHNNVLIIKHQNDEEEIFEMLNPLYSLQDENDGIWEFTIFFENTKPITRAKEFEEIIDVDIIFDATVLLAADNIDLKVGKTMFQEEGYDYNRDINLSNFYYYEHNNIEAVNIEIVKVHNDYLILNINAKTIINCCKNNKPYADLIIKNGKFMFTKEPLRSVQ